MTVVNKFRVSTIFGFGRTASADPSEAAESFVMENHDLVKSIHHGFVVDQSDVDDALQNSFEESLASYKGGYRAFRAAFYRELERWYSVKRSAIGLICK
jgi:hypothetical protein